MENSVIIICRTNSKRLKNKSILKFRNKSVLEYMIENILSAKIKKKHIYICTTRLKEDDKIEKIAKKNKIKIIRGPLRDIIFRVKMAFDKYNIDRSFITSADNPLFLSDLAIKLGNFKNIDVAYSENLPTGLNLVYCTKKGINKIYKKYLTKNNENGFYLYFTKINLKKKKINIRFPSFLKKFRFTIDYKEDFTFFKKITSLLRNQTLNIRNINKILKLNENINQINFKKNEKYQENLRKKVKIYFNYNSKIIKKINYR